MDSKTVMIMSHETYTNIKLKYTTESFTPRTRDAIEIHGVSITPRFDKTKFPSIKKTIMDIFIADVEKQEVEKNNKLDKLLLVFDKSPNTETTEEDKINFLMSKKNVFELALNVENFDEDDLDKLLETNLTQNFLDKLKEKETVISSMFLGGNKTKVIRKTKKLNFIRRKTKTKNGRI